MVPYAVAGIIAFALAGLGIWIAGGPGRWVQICVAGVLWGLVGLAAMIRHDRNRRSR
ncbi:MAG TPA: DUF2530 domain-containing protein [Micromonosporaceae bacterium]|nr:DUF2530 domain-containing protein [Micromonosporaceae bacterium]HCU48698.1 DUF2530 domain-containing protein [Micromonosporaceae bacterium]